MLFASCLQSARALWGPPSAASRPAITIAPAANRRAQQMRSGQGAGSSKAPITNSAAAGKRKQSRSAPAVDPDFVDQVPAKRRVKCTGAAGSKQLKMDLRGPSSSSSSGGSWDSSVSDPDSSSPSSAVPHQPGTSPLLRDDPQAPAGRQHGSCRAGPQPTRKRKGEAAEPEPSGRAAKVPAPASRPDKVGPAPARGRYPNGGARPGQGGAAQDSSSDDGDWQDGNEPADDSPRQPSGIQNALQRLLTQVRC